MASLNNTGNGYVTNVYGDLLWMNNSNNGITGTLQTVYSGTGAASIIQLSTTTLNVNGVFQINGATAAFVPSNVTFSGNFTTTITSTAICNATLPSGTTTLVPTAGTGATGTWGISISGNAATSTTVTTNANTTGDVTSSGNTTTVAKIAGVAVGTPTGTTNVVFSNSPTLVTPALGTPSALVLTNATGTPSAIGLANGTGLPPAGLSAPVTLAKGGSGQVNSQSLVQRVHSNITSTNGTSTIPLDNTIPQNTEGSQIASQAITPKSSSNILVIQATFTIGSTSSANYHIASLFQDSGANAIGSWLKIVNSSSVAGVGDQFVLKFVVAAGTTLSTTFNLRYGQSAGSGSWYTNSNPVASLGNSDVINFEFEIFEYTP